MLPFADLRWVADAIGDHIAERTTAVIRSGRYVLGPEVDGFEQRFATYCGVAHGIGVGSGLDALVLVLRAWGIGEGDEVIVPSHTFIATWLAVEQVGARVVPVEPDPQTLTLDASQLEAAITDRTRAIIPVHLYCQPADMGAIMPIARRHGLRVLEDASQVHGARLGSARVGSLGDAAAFSLYPTKPLGGIGDGGIITTADAALADRLRTLRNYGSAKKYHHTIKGVNSRLDPIQAAVLDLKLDHLDGWLDARARMADRYLRELRDLPGLVLPQLRDDCTPSWHLFVVRCDARDALRQHLLQRGVQTMLHYPVPCHRSECYRDEAVAQMHLPIADETAATCLSLPLDMHLSEADIGLVIKAVRSFFDKETA